MAEPRYLKNAWADKDADGNYWLYIQGDNLQAMFCLSHKEDADEDSIPRRALAAWLAEQDKSDGSAVEN